MYRRNKMSKITHDEILDSCIKGIKTSFDEYSKWSGDELLCNAPEYLLTVNIAKSLWKIDKSKFITLEDSIRKTVKTAGAKVYKKDIEKIRVDGRSDIILWWAKGTPRGIIEVKNCVFNFNHIKDDLKRIIGILKKKSDIELGVITFYIEKEYKNQNASQKIKNRINKKFIKQIEKIAKKEKLKTHKKYKKILNEETNSAFAVAIMLYK